MEYSVLDWTTLAPSTGNVYSILVGIVFFELDIFAFCVFSTLHLDNGKWQTEEKLFVIGKTFTQCVEGVTPRVGWQSTGEFFAVGEGLFWLCEHHMSLCMVHPYNCCLLLDYKTQYIHVKSLVKLQWNILQWFILGNCSGICYRWQYCYTVFCIPSSSATRWEISAVHIFALSYPVFWWMILI